MVLLADATPVIMYTTAETRFKITAAQLERAITPRTRMLWLNSPSNPSGMAYSKAELSALGEVLRKHPQIVIATDDMRSEEHTSELQSLMRNSYAVFGLQTKKKQKEKNV